MHLSDGLGYTIDYNFINPATYPYPQSIEWFIEGKAFSRSQDSAPRSPPLPPSVNSTRDTQEDWERETTWWREGGGGEEPNHTTARKPDPL